MHQDRNHVILCTHRATYFETYLGSLPTQDGGHTPAMLKRPMIAKALRFCEAELDNILEVLSVQLGDTYALMPVHL